MRDSVDDHIEQWLPLLVGLDPDAEGAITRMQHLVRHIRKHKDAMLAKHDLQAGEFDTLHTLMRLGEPHRTTPTRLATELAMSPAAMTGRLDALAQRGFVRRAPSTTDRRKVDIELTEAGKRAWTDAIADMGFEETRVLAVLNSRERRQLSDLLRRVLIAAEKGPPPPQ
ncbi:MarR family winged helix-turn-helix transcriptional regulator [Asanoa iriomotensis]|uniref:MarR family transcriptional regulator n=1 Tax=Asanoa iriomotensis TaxID=234613 RepID=A0ABQ4C4M2_9ACTN|nr:MarR family transcriptional regulator [Asanoa iriomotensis]GIF57724.1 MarR family transcriptional regulator [Asanoa iriomotensis]